ncbi:MFS transporter [Lactiplantibacillus fabifermentans]|uniref:Integral membrane protein n=2 Tax=Lactiplantibacillus fabifermentans TaxID=483011 RepID=A0A0R2NN43_9LACO|nr:MFS transporter [Lactiplantibacillus fabifermentans]ETY73332.1 MFS transporter [Lactiplantibacillus fabifermentans T30PCM01]KRO26780.1 integral membrane protein [Lactiplantibacillus fabifermentans DSM 21115]
MTTILKNRTLQTLVGANFLATLGISLFNIILLTYAKSFAQSQWLVSVVSVAEVCPFMFNIVMGRLADQTRAKARLQIVTKFIQAGLYLILAQLINQHTVGIFYLVVLCNVMSTLCGNYGSSLFNITMQNRIAAADRQQAYGINQSVGTIMSPVGQALGVFVLAVTHDYALAGYVNATTFLLAALWLLAGYRQITVPFMTTKKAPFRSVWRTASQVIYAATAMPTVSFLGIIMLLNVVSMSLDGVLNLYLLRLTPKWGLPYATVVLVVNIVFVIGNVLGGITKRTWADRLTLRQLTFLTTLMTGMTYVMLLVWPTLPGIVLAILVAMFFTGKLDPKMYALITMKVTPNMTGSVLGLISTVVTIAAPAGSTSIVLLYNLAGPAWAFSVAIVLALIVSGWTLLTGRLHKQIVHVE